MLEFECKSCDKIKNGVKDPDNLLKDFEGGISGFIKCPRCNTICNLNIPEKYYRKIGDIMSFKLFEEASRKRREDYMQYVRDDIVNIKENYTVITKELLPERSNSYESQFLMDKWSDKLLIEKTKYYLENSGNEFYRTDIFELGSTYNEVLKHKIIHMLLERLENNVNG